VEPLVPVLVARARSSYLTVLSLTGWRPDTAGLRAVDILDRYPDERPVGRTHAISGTGLAGVGEVGEAGRPKQRQLSSIWQRRPGADISVNLRPPNGVTQSGQSIIDDDI
jgi:hypothetical protein